MFVVVFLLKSMKTGLFCVNEGYPEKVLKCCLYADWLNWFAYRSFKFALRVREMEQVERFVYCLMTSKSILFLDQQIIILKWLNCEWCDLMS